MEPLFSARDSPDRGAGAQVGDMVVGPSVKPGEVSGGA